MSREWFQIAIVLLIALALRLYLVEQPLVDKFAWRQVSTAMMAHNFHHRDLNILYPEVSWAGPEPGYQGRELQTVSYIAALLYFLLGQHDWIGRLVAIGFGVWGVYALYKLVSISWNSRFAILASAILAILPGAIYVDRSFLPDPAMVSLTTTGCWLFVRYCKARRNLDLVISALFLCLGILAKLPALIIGIPLLYASIMYISRMPSALRPKEVIKLFTTALIMLVPIISYYLWALYLAENFPSGHFAGENNWIWDDGIASWIANYYFLPAFADELLTWLWGGPILVLILIGIFIKPKPRHLPVFTGSPAGPCDQDFYLPWFFHYWLLAFAIYYLIGAQQLTINIWNQHFANPAAAAVAASCLIMIFSGIRAVAGRRVSFVLLVVAMMAQMSYSMSLLSTFYRPSYQQHYLIGKNASRLGHPSELVISFGLEPVSIYYSQKRGWVFPPSHKWNEPDIWSDDKLAIAALDELISMGAKWLIIPDTPAWFHVESLKDNHESLYGHILRNFSEAYTGPDGKVFRLR